jgi:type II secretory pathway component GspD/PulD (secretin)
MGIVVGVVLLGAVASTHGQTPVRPAQVHAALNSGIDCYRRADYEAAATFFKKADEGKADLSMEEQQELATLMRINAVALKERNDGLDKLHQAEKAVQEGRSADAQAMLKAVTINQYLTTADKARAQRLADMLRGGGSTSGVIQAGASTSKGVTPAVLARTKLQQARNLMAKANYDAAESLAHEVMQMHVTYAPGEDTPQKVLTDIVVAKSNAKGLLVAARTALQVGDLDRAERLAHAAEEASGAFTFHPWGDSPAKVLKEVQVARARTPSSTGATAKGDEIVVTAGNKAESARLMVKQGRKALQQGDVAGARQWALEAQAQKVDFHWWEDTPAKLINDIQRTPGADKIISTQDAGKSTSGSSPESSTRTGAEDPHVSLQRARSLYNADKLDEAEKIVHSLQTKSFVAWGLFDDSPDKLLLDIRKARMKHNQDESVRVMAEARMLFERGDYEGARSKAYAAERLHGPYSVWELGDRPAKLIAEIQAAQAQNPHKGPAKASEMAVVQADAKKAGPETVKPAGFQTDGHKDAGSSPYMAVGPAMPPAPGTPGLVGDSIKGHASQLLVEARKLQNEGRLVEARQKALEAQKAGGTFRIDEDSPDRALQQLASLANKRIESLLQEATDLAATGAVDPTRFPRAEEKLNQARQLAVGFSMDTNVVDAKMVWFKRTRDQSLVAAKPGIGPMPPVPSVAKGPELPAIPDMPAGPKSSGQEMLEKARLELSRGELETARRLAVEVYGGPYGLQVQADALLHSIDAEEYNQRILTANRSLDAGVNAYYHKDYAQASAILRSIDSGLLSKEKQSRLKELMMVPELQPKAVARPAVVVPVGLTDAGKATASDAPGAVHPTSPEETFTQQVLAMQEVKFQKLRQEGLEVQRKATEAFRNGETSQALDILQDYLDTLRDAQLEPDRLALLQRPVDSRLQQFKTLKAQQDWEHLQAGQHDTFNRMQAQAAKAEDHKKKQIEDLMKQYHDYFKEGKYKEAEMAAMKAHELDPDDPAPAAAVHVAKMQGRVTDAHNLRDRKEQYALDALNNAEDPGVGVDGKEPLKFDREEWARVADRKALPKDGYSFDVKTEKEREIERRLALPISLDFKDTPLKQVIDDLRDLTGINIVADMAALEEENISLDRPVSMHLEGISTKSALNLVLHQAHLIYVIKDEVLQITTEAHARGKLVSRTYQVADLVIPVENAQTPSYSNLEKILDPQNARSMISGATPINNPNGLRNGTPVGNASMTSSPPVGAGSAANGGRAPGATIEDLLIKVITSTIKPESWSDMGGPGTIEYFPLGLALVVTQTPDIQEQVAELLQALRRLQDVEIAIEVRFITISEAFFERMGLDFNINILADNTKYEPQIISQQFQPFGFNNDFSPSHFVTGLQPVGNRPPGNYTSDLNIPIRDTSFGPAIPPFGGYPNTPGADGGLSLGLAFLSDIQVFLFMEAAQGDNRSNVMSAPKLTLFNGQTSLINITDLQFFVTNILFVQAGGQVAIIPQNQAIPTGGGNNPGGGINMTILGLVSADRRFVRLNINQSLTNISPVDTALFPVTTFVTPVFDNGAQGQPIPFTQFIQQPKINTITVNTTVTVPDGGTVLLGGLKTLREGRTEYGPPILSKIPYINRLFKNVGYGREAESFMMMVTPRIIINEEEETRQTGVGTGLGLGGAPPGAPQP